MAKTSIEWTDRSWNFLRGCSMISPGCKHCYAMKQAHRFSGPGGTYEGLTELGPDGPRWTGKIRVVDEKFAEPLHVRKPQRWFVNSMSDLFHEDVPFEVIDKAFAVMALSSHHTFLILTKRPARMHEYLAGEDLQWRIATAADTDEFFKLTHWDGLLIGENPDTTIGARRWAPTRPKTWPLSNVRLGPSVENQKYADERFPTICAIGEAGWNTMVSLEPLLSPVVIPDRYLALGSRAWPIIGGESGNGASQCDLAWIRNLVQQCKAAEVACFVKQLGARAAHKCAQCYDGMAGHCRMFKSSASDVGHGQDRLLPLYLKDRKGGDMSEWPQDLRVREFPKEAR